MYVNYKKFDVSKLSFEKENDKKVTFLAKYNIEPFKIKTPKVIAESDIIEIDKLVSLELDLNSKTMIRVFNEIDNAIVKFAATEFNTHSAIIEEYFVPSVKKGSFFKCRIPFKEDGKTIDTEFYDNKDNLIDLEKYSYKNLVKKDDLLELVLELPEIRILNKKIIKCNYYVTHMKINKKITNSLFEDSESSDDSNNSDDADD